MLYISAISVALLLALVLLTKRNKTKADGILACWLLVIGVHLVQYYLDITVDPYYFPYLMIGFPLPLFHGPMLYFYTSSLTNQHFYLRKHWVWHFAPVVLVYVLMIPFFLLSHSEKLLVFENRGKGFVFVLVIQRILVYASGAVYVILSLWLLRKHKQTVRDRFSQVEKINLTWLRYLIYGMGLQWLAVFYGNDRIIFSLVALFVMLLGYFGIKQVGIFTNVPPTNEPAIETSTEIEEKNSAAPEQHKARYLKSTLSLEAQQVIHEKLSKAMNDQKLFLNPELTITELASRLSVHPNHLSQVINSLESKTFYDFINGKRIEEFKRIVALPENQKYTLLALAFECGFNSKTAFYRNFKNITGQSPTLYLRQEHIKIQSD
ncbi:MAG: AraC family transcriptional regulator [Cyclobacteriaceae bacterium]|nr:AraC family transcriptional regulator [Cyclobacteriaceae bacterium]